MVEGVCEAKWKRMRDKSGEGTRWNTVECTGTFVASLGTYRRPRHFYFTHSHPGTLAHIAALFPDRNALAHVGVHVEPPLRRHRDPRTRVMERLWVCSKFSAKVGHGAEFRPTYARVDDVFLVLRLCDYFSPTPYEHPAEGLR